MSDRAPDGQPTENIRTVLNNLRKDRDHWVNTAESLRRSLASTDRIVLTAEQAVRRWERYLAIRLAEEAAKEQEVTGL